MKKKNIFLVFALFIAMGLSAQTANYNANGSYKGTEVNSVNVDFSTLSATALTFSTSLQEIIGVGVVKYKTATRVYPFTGGSSMVTLLQDNTASGQEGNDISPAYIYLPTMANGVGRITVGANLPQAPVTTRTIGVQYSVDGGSTWLTKTGAANISVPSGSSVAAPLDFNMSGKVQLRLSFANSTAYLVVKSITVTPPNFTASGTYAGTPVTSIDVDFSTLAASSLTFSTAVQEISGVGVTKFKTSQRPSYPYVGGSSMVTLLQDNTNLGQEGTDVSPAYIYLPTLSNGVGTISVNANICSSGTLTGNIKVEYTVDGGNTWLTKAGAENIPVSSGANLSLPLIYNLAGSVQLRLSYVNGNFWVAIKSIGVTSKPAAQFNTYGSYVGTPVSSINVDFSTLSATSVLFSTQAQEINGVCLVKFKTALRDYPFTNGSSMVTLLQDNNAAGQEGNDVSPAYIYLPTLANGVGVISLGANLPSATVVTKNIAVEYSNDGGNTWLSNAGAANILIPSGSSTPSDLVYNMAGAIQLRLKYANSTSYLVVKSINVTSLGSTAVNALALESGIYINGNILNLGNETANVIFYNLNGQKIMQLNGVSGAGISLPSSSGIVKVINNKGVITLRKM